MMKSLITDVDALLAVSPTAVAAFARRNGWQYSQIYRDHADLYYHPSFEAEAVFPRTTRIVDYASIVSNAIGIFSRQLNESQDEIYKKLVDAENDVFRVRALEASEDGTINIEGGIDLISQAKEVLLAAACATSTPQPVYRAGANRDAAEFMKSVRLGQTGHGSFIVNLLNRVPPQLQPSLIEDWAPISDEPIERKVSRRLAEALSSLRSSAEEVGSGRGLESFEASVERGVSANLCDAVSKMINAVEDVELSINWAVTRPVPIQSISFTFGSDDGAIFREAARKLREKRPRSGVVLYGVVHKLSRRPEEDDGTVTLKAEVDGTVQSVSATLDSTNYNAAVSAHRSKFPVFVEGDLERVGARWRLTSASVRVLEASVSEDDEGEGEETTEPRGR